MATIESLDLASLQNNPQSIAEALEDALETTDGTIGSLKTSAQSKKNDIDDLYDDALTKKNQIDALFTASSQTEDYSTSTLDDSWVAWDITNPPNYENGLQLFRYGKIYVAHLSIYKGNVTAAVSHSSTIKTLSSTDISLPSQTVKMGISKHATGTEDDWVSSMEFETDGDVTLYFVNHTGTTMHILGNFIGIDLG
mgnify:CR=1 FL=1